MKRLIRLSENQMGFSYNTFGSSDERDGSSPAAHLIKEAKELKTNPSDIMEGADCFLLDS